MIRMASQHFTVLYPILLCFCHDALKYSHTQLTTIHSSSVGAKLGRFLDWLRPSYSGGCHEEWETLWGRPFVLGRLDADRRRLAAFGLRHCRRGRPGRFVVWQCRHQRRRPNGASHSASVLGKWRLRAPFFCWTHSRANGRGSGSGIISCGRSWGWRRILSAGRARRSRRGP